MSAGLAQLWIGVVCVGLGLAGCAATPRTGVAVAPSDTLSVAPFGPVFEEARAVAADGSGRLYVADAGAATVTVLSAEGLPLIVLGGPGTGDYAFLDPSGIDPTNGLVLVVADTGNGRLQRFSYDGRLIETLPVPSNLGDGDSGRREFRDTPTSDRRAGQGRPTAVAAAVTGETYAVEEVQGLVLRWDERRRFDRVIGGLEEDEGALSQPVGVAVGPDGRLFVADRGHAAVLVYDPFGLYLRRIADGTARGIRAVAVVGDRLVLTLPHEVRLYSLDGRLVDAFAVPTPEPLVGVAGNEGRLVLLTPTRLFAATPPR
jgi:DNA-binding beta-propeller fold protein YncE